MNQCTHTRRGFLKSASLALAAIPMARRAASAARKPNIVIVFADDLGYGDLGTFGNPTIRTPNLDRLAIEGQKWTSFYVAAPVCTPSRAGLLTGRLPIRNGMCSAKSRVLFPDSVNGLPEDEITIAEALKAQGYATMAVGKWHLGHHPQYLPTSNGFDSYYGIPYSNDMDKIRTGDDLKEPKPDWFKYNVPLMRDTVIVERPADQTTITKRYTQEGINFIKANKDKPFFLYLAHNMPHIPLFANAAFEGKSPRGKFGDVVEEIDEGIGRIIQTLKDEGLAENTLFLFTSDNGPWLIFKEDGGSAGLLRGGKGSTFEGGMREPAVFWWPGKIKPKLVTEMGSTLDVFPTVCALTGAPFPDDRIMDGYDLGPVLFGDGHSPRDAMFYYREAVLHAVRKGPWKAHYITQSGYANDREEHDPPLLYNVENDPSEQYDLSKEHPEIIAMINKVRDEHLAKMVKGKDMLADRIKA